MTLVTGGILPLTTYNQTVFSSDELRALTCIGRVKLMRQERYVIIYQHPTVPERVITVETLFSDQARYIRDTPRSEWPSDLSSTRTIVWN
jgi:hypothetical protein